MKKINPSNLEIKIHIGVRGDSKIHYSRAEESHKIDRPCQRRTCRDSLSSLHIHTPREKRLFSTLVCLFFSQPILVSLFCLSLGKRKRCLEESERLLSIGVYPVVSARCQSGRQSGCLADRPKQQRTLFPMLSLSLSLSCSFCFFGSFSDWQRALDPRSSCSSLSSISLVDFSHKNAYTHA